jgi:hypothetical protein
MLSFMQLVGHVSNVHRDFLLQYDYERIVTEALRRTEFILLLTVYPRVECGMMRQEESNTTVDCQMCAINPC